MGSFSYPSLNVLSQLAVRAGEAGLDNGLIQSCMAAGRAIAPVIAGALWSFTMSHAGADQRLAFYSVAFLVALQLAATVAFPRTAEDT